MDDGEEADDAVCPVCEGSTYVGELRGLHKVRAVTRDYSLSFC